jgi:hypothetical protein
MLVYLIRTETNATCRISLHLVFAFIRPWDAFSNQSLLMCKESSRSKTLPWDYSPTALPLHLQMYAVFFRQSWLEQAFTIIHSSERFTSRILDNIAYLVSFFLSKRNSV